MMDMVRIRLDGWELLIPRNRHCAWEPCFRAVDIRLSAGWVVTFGPRYGLMRRKWSSAYICTAAIISDAEWNRVHTPLQPTGCGGFFVYHV
ncbi:hypothetical protein [Paenibacillus albus]|uniref:Uncharacterized protein n=1 Tax=Paenibacillus albus TaxID=2495582 RepID=A0A3S8ZY86_9BACL|nr:hypothetical protein [Paenibacillus albus]AZN38449.1 hypothetical protein EJC50_01265 [Paenibacillus albus]